MNHGKGDPAVRWGTAVVVAIHREAMLPGTAHRSGRDTAASLSMSVGVVGVDGRSRDGAGARRAGRGGICPRMANPDATPRR